VTVAWEGRLDRWVEAGVLDASAAERIRDWERSHGGTPGPSPPGLRWPIRLALGLGGLLVGAGILLFVAAHWDALSPGARFALVLATVAGLHLLGATADERWPALGATLHACGTAALGGGIFLSGQIFNLEEHWPGGLLLWALGAGLAWLLLRDWAQAMLLAVLTPAWLAGEWSVATERQHGEAVLAAGLLLLALVYLGAWPGAGRADSPARRALVWIGGIAVIPTACLVVATPHVWQGLGDLTPIRLALGATVALGAPLGLAWLLYRSIRPALLGLAAWTALGPILAAQRGVVPYVWAAGLSLGLIAWGVIDRRAERINLGVAGFALTVLVFYFSSVMDRLGRSASLVGLGLLFLGGGWALERTRRQLVASVTEQET
ncbi:MAG TPA: DUF2157 domain-containing protein, partial [Gemmatimonadales bacterium]|nr:DUF2157 domain-containing protein [Gemmatimonadales bacterium]